MAKTLAEQAKERDNHTCQKCGRTLTKTRLEAHHIHPESAGGADELDNLVTLCKQCHNFAPMRPDEEEAINATEIFLSSGLPPALDLFLFGAEWAMLIDEDDVEHIDPAKETLAAALENMKTHFDQHVPIRQSGWYFVLMATLASQRVSKAPERVEMKYAKEWLSEDGQKGEQ